MADEIGEYFTDMTGLRVTDVGKLSKLDLRNRVYRISTPDADFALKVFPRNETSERRSRTEADFYRLYGGRILCLPYLLFEDMTCSRVGAPVVCREYKEGRDSKKESEAILRSGNGAGFARLVDASFDAVNSIHRLRSSSSTGSLTAVSQDDYFTFFINEKASSMGLSLERIMDFLHGIKDGSMAGKYLDSGSTVSPAAFALCHHDLRGHEILVGDGYRVNGIIDWELAAIGDPVYDFASYLFSLLNPFYRDVETQKKIAGVFMERMPTGCVASIPFYLADRAILTSIVYYSEFNEHKFRWAMNFSDRMLSAKVDATDELLRLLDS